MKASETKRPSLRTADLTVIAIAAALIAICAWISVPAAVPFTLQTFGVFFVLSLLGASRGALAILVYIFLGAIGIPVFSGFSGGMGVLLGNTGGYIVGFLLTALAYGGIVALLGKRLWTEILGLLLGLLLCYALGTAWFMAVYTRAKGAVSLGTVLSWCVFPFILPDLGKLALALFLSKRVSPALKGIHRS